MLCLTRGELETIKIGDDITVVIGKVRGRRVRVGVEAPEGVKILRGELEDRDRPEEGAAA